MLYTVLLKEAKHLFSDKGFLLIALIQPVIFIIMFGSSFQGGDINNLDTILIDNDQTEFSEYVKLAAHKSEFFNVNNFEGTLDGALSRLNKSEVRAVIFIPDGFGNNINNTKTGELDLYIDSSNFLTYSSLSGAKVEIIKDTLQNITENILDSLEEQKETGKIKLDEVKSIFDDLENETVDLNADLEELEKLKNLDIDELRDMTNTLDTFLTEQKDALTQTINSLDQIIIAINNVEASNHTEALERDAIAEQISLLRTGFSESSEELKDISEEVDGIHIPLVDPSITTSIEARLRTIKDMFEDAQELADDVDFDFEKLEKKFLSEPLKLNEKTSHGPIKYFDYLGAGVLSLIVFFVCLMAPALNIISEKEKNTLYRMSTTPVSSLTVFVGKFLLFITFGFMEMLYTLFLAIVIYDLRISGSIWNVIIILSLLACASISMGLFISSKVKSMQQALVIIPLIVIPSFLISHAFFPPDIMAGFMNYVSYITPMTFSNHALNAIMVKGFGLSDVLRDISVLLAYTFVPLFLFIWNYRRIRY